MVLELHVWGPAFSLPSLDAECIATIAYVGEVVPRAEWTLVASSDPALSPTQALPALRDGPIWVGGFLSITMHLKMRSSLEWDRDCALNEQQRADCAAFSSHIISNGQPLLDLSLYVSTENYTSATRSIYTPLLPWPTQYIIPSTHRAAAKARSAHLGLSALDVDAAEDPKPKHNPTESSERIPSSLSIKRPQTLTNLLSQPQHATQIRLHALTAAFLEPLQDLLGDKLYFFDEEMPSSLDCLALGYLSLALYPELPQPWLARAMREKYSNLVTYVDRMRSEMLGKNITLQDARLVSTNANKNPETRPTEPSSTDSQASTLPWSPPPPVKLASITSLILENMTGSLPLVKYMRPKQPSSSFRWPDDNPPTPSSKLTTQRTNQLLAATFGLSAIGSCLFYMGVFSLPSWFIGAGRGSERVGLQGMGEAGESLGALARGLDVEVGRYKGNESGRAS